MKKILFCGVVLFLALAVTAFASREEIDAAISAYEAVTVEGEALAEKELLFEESDFTAIDDKAKAADTAIAALETVREWTIQDAKRSMELRVRFNTAMLTAIKKLLQY
jgi:hypothetical protein